MIWIRVETCWMILDTSKNCSKQNTNEREEGGKSCEFRERIEGPWKRAHERYECPDGCEAYGADGVATHGVQVARYDACDEQISWEFICENQQRLLTAHEDLG